MPSAKIGEIYGELRIKLNKLQQDLNQSSQKFASWKQKNSNQLQQLASWAKRAEIAIAAIAIASIKNVPAKLVSLAGDQTVRINETQYFHGFSWTISISCCTHLPICNPVCK